MDDPQQARKLRPTSDQEWTNIETEVSMAVRAATTPIFERLEASGVVLARSTDIAQQAARFAVAILRGARWRGLQGELDSDDLGFRYRVAISGAEVELETLRVLGAQASGDQDQ